MEVLALLAAGRSNAEIGSQLGIEERTVESHLRRLFDRCGTGSAPSSPPTASETAGSTSTACSQADL